MRSSLEHLVRSFVTDAPLVLSVVALFALSISSAYPQAVPPNTPGAPAGDISNIPKGITDTMNEIAIRNGVGDTLAQGKKIAEPEANCLFPPLSQITSPVIGIEELKRTAKARNEYWQGCVALRKREMLMRNNISVRLSANIRNMLRRWSRWANYLLRGSEQRKLAMPVLRPQP